MKIYRILSSKLLEWLLPGKVIVLYGPRQVGKTTLILDLVANLTKPYRMLNADLISDRESLSIQDDKKLGTLAEGVRYLVIDEAQRVPEIGLSLKILVDSHPDLTVIATGSASFDLAGKLKEPLTGRSLTFILYPISYGEQVLTAGSFETKRSLETRLIWGSYPQIVTEQSEAVRRKLLEELVGSYLYKDLLEFGGIRHADKIIDLLRLLAFQIGNLVSHAELSSSLGMSIETVSRYLDLLEKVFVIYKLRGFSRNLRKEVTKNAKYYFYDIGVRNALIRNYNTLALRQDTGQLWENFMMMERRKTLEYRGESANAYFWRTYDRKEVDLVEEAGGKIAGYEFKWQGKRKKGSLKAFSANYPGSTTTVIDRETMDEFLLPGIQP